VLAPATLAALPSTRAIPDRDVFYVADPVSSIREQALWKWPAFAEASTFATSFAEATARQDGATSE